MHHDTRTTAPVDHRVHSVRRPSFGDRGAQPRTEGTVLGSDDGVGQTAVPWHQEIKRPSMLGS